MNLINSAFAFPFSGAALIRIFIVSSSKISTISFFGDFGSTFIRRYSLFGRFIWWVYEFAYFLENKGSDCCEDNDLPVQLSDSFKS